MRPGGISGGGRAWDARDPAPAPPCLWRASGGLRPCVSWQLRFYLPFYSWPYKKSPPGWRRARRAGGKMMARGRRCANTADADRRGCISYQRHTCSLPAYVGKCEQGKPENHDLRPPETGRFFHARVSQVSHGRAATWLLDNTTNLRAAAGQRTCRAPPRALPPPFCGPETGYQGGQGGSRS